MNNSSDPMQGFLDQLLRDWENGGPTSPSTPVKQSKPAATPGAAVIPTPGVASVVRALPELSEAMTLTATEVPAPPARAQAPVVEAKPVPPPVAEVVVPVRQVEPPVTPPESGNPTLSWNPAPVAAKPVFQWPPAPATAGQQPAVVESAPPPAPVAAEQPAKPAFQWRPAPPPVPVVTAESVATSTDPLASTVPDLPKPAFQWLPASAPASAAASSPPAQTDEVAQAQAPKPSFQWKPAPPPAAAAPPSSTPPALADFAAALSALKASRLTPPPAPPVFVPEPAAEAMVEPDAVAQEPEPIASTVRPDMELAFPESFGLQQEVTSAALPKPVEEERPEEEAIVGPELAYKETKPEFEALAEEEERVASLHLANQQAALLESLLSAQTGEVGQSSWINYDWDEEVPVPESVAPAAMEAEPRIEQPEVELRAETGSEAEAVLEVEEAAPEAEIEAAVEAEVVAEAEPEAEAEVEVEAVAAPEAEIEAAVEAEVVAEAESEAEAEVEVEAVAPPEVEIEAAVEAGNVVMEAQPEDEAPVEVESAAEEIQSQPLLPLDPTSATAEPEWEEIAVPPFAAPGPDLASVVSGLETELPAEQEDESVDGRRAELRRHLVFVINDERFAVNLDNLIEIDNMPNWTGIPGLPASVRGLINLRGEIVSLLELRAILGLPYPEIPRKGKIFVATTADRQATSAFAVDEIEGIVGFDQSLMKAIPPLTSAKVSKSITATVEDGDRMVRILDVGSVLSEVEQAFSLDQIWM